MYIKPGGEVVYISEVNMTYLMLFSKQQFNKCLNIYYN